MPADTESHTLSGLQPDTEYIATILPLYEGAEGPAATTRFKIGMLGSVRTAAGGKTRRTQLHVRSDLLIRHITLHPCTHSFKQVVASVCRKTMDN